ncbi:unnamed protein product [Periconia digitata]|uniref:Uncharacterized protein n=1 Tax=Periconia digitata TaxID=1303443 RepID=A0A9W4UWQ2_9PLEO|nr:unnamed protein product [Periconia digitata]
MSAATLESDLERGIMPTPRGYTTLRDSEYAFIHVFSGRDKASEARRKLQIEWDSSALVNPKFDEYEGDRSDPMQRLVLVFISGFFTDGTDFIYMIEGADDMSKFWLGTFSGKSYNRPCWASPVTVYEFDEIFSSPGLEAEFSGEVSKTETKGLRWKYHYESGLEAWSSLVFSQERYEQIKQADEDHVRELSLQAQKTSEEKGKQGEKQDGKEEEKKEEEEGSKEGEVRIPEQGDSGRSEEGTDDGHGDDGSDATT